MSKKKALIELIFKLHFNPKLLINSELNESSNIAKKEVISFNKAIIISSVLLISFISGLLLFQNYSYLKTVFSDIISPIIEIIVVLSLFYAAKISGKEGKRTQIAWLILGIAVLSYAIGDSLWAILELVIHQQPFPSVADIFYLLFYPLFALGIYYLPRKPLSRKEELKLIMDTAIIIITVSLILWTFLIIPTVNSNQDILASFISISYIIGDIILFFALIRILFNNFNAYRGPLILLGIGIVFQVITDSFYSYQSLHGIYISGGFLDTGWVLSFIFVGLAAILQINTVIYPPKSIKSRSRTPNLNFSSYLPLVGVSVAYILLIWTNYNLIFPNSEYMEIAVGAAIFLVLFRQAITIHENKNLYLSAKKEINNRKMVEKDLIESKNHFQSIFDNAPIGIFHSSPEGKLYEVNQGLARLLGYESPEEHISIANKTNVKFVYLDKEKREMLVEEAFNEDSWHTHENRLHCKDGSTIIVELSMKAIRNSDGSVKYLEGFMKDITKRKKAENEIKTSLKDKEVLLKEIHHRVKNNLQIISSLLDLQANYVNDEEAVNVLQESQNRVKSMATIHEMLYQSADLASINFSNYIQTLVRDLFYSYGAENIESIIKVDHIFLNIETAIPCGLIVSELVSNSLKYAFPHNRKGEIFISIHSHNEEFELIISDNGIGLPENLNFKDIKSSLGLRLVNMLVKQLEGSIELDRTNGTKFCIKFKELKYKKRF